MRLFVTGATGFIGAHTARRFAEAGYTLRLLLRPQSRCDLLDGVPFERADGDVTDRASVERALPGCDAVVHIAGVTSFLPKDAARVHAVNVDGVRNVLESALAQGLRKVLFTSSVSAVGASRSPHGLLDESSTWDLHREANAYVRSKRHGEEAAMAIAARGLDLITVCPTVVLGPGDQYGSSTLFLLNYVKGRFPAYIEGGQSYVDVRDVAEGHLLAFEKGVPGERYILSAENVSAADFVALLGRTAGMRPIPKMPYAIAAAAAAGSELLARFNPKFADFNRGTVSVGRLYWYFHAHKSREALGLTYRSIEQSARDTLVWAMQHGFLRPNNPTLKALHAEHP